MCDILLEAIALDSQSTTFRWVYTYEYWKSGVDIMANTKGQALIDEIAAEYIKNDTPDFRPGDNVKVFVKIQEGDHTRLQAFEGLVIKRQGHGVSATFTVRKDSYGVGVERTFPVNAPVIDHIQVLRHGKVRRARLNYIRTLSAKAARIKEKR